MTLNPKDYMEDMGLNLYDKSIMAYLLSQISDQDTAVVACEDICISLSLTNEQVKESLSKLREREYIVRG